MSQTLLTKETWTKYTPLTLLSQQTRTDLFVIKSLEHRKNLKTGHVPYLVLELIKHVTKSQINLERQSLSVYSIFLSNVCIILSTSSFRQYKNTYNLYIQGKMFLHNCKFTGKYAFDKKYCKKADKILYLPTEKIITNSGK